MVENVGVVAVLGQGAMGSAVAGRMVATGIDVVSVLEGRSAASRKRAEAAGVRAGTWSDLEDADGEMLEIARFIGEPAAGGEISDGMARLYRTIASDDTRAQSLMAFIEAARRLLATDPGR